MLNLLASISPEDVGQIIATLIGAGVVSGGVAMTVKAKPVKVEPQPLVIDKVEKFATKAELHKVAEELGDDLDRLDKRIDQITPTLGELKGKLDSVATSQQQILQLLLNSKQ